MFSRADGQRAAKDSLFNKTLMLKKSLRLTASRDFANLYRSGQRYSTRNLRFFCLKSQGVQSQNLSRFGFVVSKKQVAKIAARNRTKRMLRAIVSKNLSKFPSGCKCVILAKPGIDHADFKQLELEIQDLFRKIH